MSKYFLKYCVFAFAKANSVMAMAISASTIIFIRVERSGVPDMLRIPVAKPSGRNTTVTYVKRSVFSEPRYSRSE